MFLTCPSGELSGKIEADFISEGLGWVTAPQSEALFGKNWQKNCRISETKRFDPLKSNSPLYKPHQMGPFQERNFFFFFTFFDPKKRWLCQFSGAATPREGTTWTNIWYCYTILSIELSIFEPKNGADRNKLGNPSPPWSPPSPGWPWRWRAGPWWPPNPKVVGIH